jgi:hypothetical protein
VTIGAVLVALTACSRHGSDAALDASAPTFSASAATSLAALSPFTAAGASAARQDESRFPGHLVALAWETRVYEKPSEQSTMLGYLRAGANVRAADSASGNDGCKGGWYAVAPAGYVCVEAGNASLDVEHPIARALARRPDTSAHLPYMYGVVRRQGPLYARLPSRAEAEAAEAGLAAHMEKWLAEPGEEGAGFRADSWLQAKKGPFPSPAELWQGNVTREVPSFLEGDRVPPGNLSGLLKGPDLVLGSTLHHNGFAFIDTAVRDGRRYGITSRLVIIALDRMRPIEGSMYRGYEIPKDIDFPFALVRREGAAAYTLKKGKLVKAKDLFRRAAIKLSGHQRFVDKRLYFETADGLWVSDHFVSRLDPAKRMPKWGNDGERWMDVSIAKQTLVAYEGTKPVFATVVSTGEAGLEDPEKTKSTKRGIFRVHTKHLTTTMDSNVVGEEFELQDIPYVQYFENGYALHAAYWHDDFGTPRSHGCINLSPEDARWLFGWTEPRVPDGWHGARMALHGSVVFVHE